MSHHARNPAAETDFRACGHCRRVYHLRERYRGRGRHLDEHPEHEYAPCGHSQTWYGATFHFEEEEPPTGLEFFDPDDLGSEPDYGGAFDGFAVTSDADPGL